jgi:tetratricopeptide (TPR) repeat protein
LPRLAVLGLACVALLPAASPDAGETNAAWQTLVLAATRAATAKDFRSAEELLQRATRITARFPAGDPRTGTTQNTLGLVYKQEKKYAEAEKAFRNALTMLEKSYGPASLDVANVDFNIASVLVAGGKYEASLPYIEKSRGVYEKIMGAESLKAATTWCLLGEAYRNMNRFNDAEKPLKRCADMREASGGMESPELADALYSLAMVYQHQGKLKQAEARFRLSAKIRELTLGVTSPEFAEALAAHSALLKTMGREPEARKEEALVEAVKRQQTKH